MVLNTTRRKKKGLALSPGPYQCHPSVTPGTHGCLPLSTLKEAATLMGVKGPHLREKLETALGVPPQSEMSLLRALPLSEERKRVLATRLRPAQPTAWRSDPDMWLDSTNIEAVMKQYEEAYPDFEFMGPYPIDFAAPDPYTTGETHCLINEICELRVAEALKTGTRKIGIIYNLDPHFKSGSHWVAAFIDIPKHRAYYFDSYGIYPPKQIATFLKWLTLQDTRMKLQYNGRRFQHSDTECGMYSLYFIIRMIAGENFRAFTRQSPRDSEMLKLRHWIFST